MLTCNKKSWLLEENYIVIKVCNATNSHLLIIMKSNRLTQLFEMSIIDVYYYMVILKKNWGGGGSNCQMMTLTCQTLCRHDRKLCRLIR